MNGMMCFDDDAKQTTKRTKISKPKHRSKQNQKTSQATPQNIKNEKTKERKTIKQNTGKINTKHQTELQQ